jgi:hypothetical protein
VIQPKCNCQMCKPEFYSGGHLIDQYDFEDSESPDDKAQIDRSSAVITWVAAVILAGFVIGAAILLLSA